MCKNISEKEEFEALIAQINELLSEIKNEQKNLKEADRKSTRLNSSHAT